MQETAKIDDVVDMMTLPGWPSIENSTDVREPKLKQLCGRFDIAEVIQSEYSNIATPLFPAAILYISW